MTIQSVPDDGHGEPPDPKEPKKPGKPEKKRRVPRTHSTIGLEPISDEEVRAARMPPLIGVYGTAWFVRRLYLDAFYRTIDREYRAFMELGAPPAERAAIGSRVGAAIRTIAAFSAWYSVIWRFLALGYVLALVAAALVAAGVGYVVLQPHWDRVAAAAAGVVALPVLAVAAWLLLRLPRVWPFDVLVLVVAAAVFGTVAQVSYLFPLQFWAFVPLLVSASGVAVMCFVTVIVLSIAQAASQLVTWRKISEWPEEEIIQTTTFVLGRLHRAGAAWRLPECRGEAAENCEWIARRFERNFTARYATGDPAVDAAMNGDAARCAAAFRARRRELAFPGASAPAHVSSFLWNALRAQAESRWGELDRETPPAVQARPVLRVFAVVRNVAAIAIPAAVALAVHQFNLFASDGALQQNVVITGFSWSVLALLAAVNPRSFETQASTAKTLGELLKKG